MENGTLGCCLFDTDLLSFQNGLLLSIAESSRSVQQNASLPYKPSRITDAGKTYGSSTKIEGNRGVLSWEQRFRYK